MKPLKETKFFSVLNRAIEKMKLNERYLNLSLSGEMERIPLHEIKYIDVIENYTTICSVCHFYNNVLILIKSFFLLF